MAKVRLAPRPTLTIEARIQRAGERLTDARTAWDEGLTSTALRATRRGMADAVRAFLDAAPELPADVREAFAFKYAAEMKRGLARDEDDAELRADSVDVAVDDLADFLRQVETLLEEHGLLR